MTRRFVLHAAFVAALGVTALAGDARADDVGACKAASERGQSRLGEGRFREARVYFLECARERCPTAVRNACVRDYEEVERAQPTVVVRAQDAAGRDVVGVRVDVDGETVQPRLTGKAIPVDPGPHTFRFVTASGDAAEQVVLVVQGQREREVRARFERILTTNGDRVGAPRALRERDETPAEPPRRSWSRVILAGAVGAVGLASFGGLQASGWSEYHDLRAAGCGETRACDEGSTRAKFIAADVALGVGIVGIGAAAVLAIVEAAR